MRQYLSLLVEMVTMVVTKKNAATIIVRATKIKGAETVTQISISNSFRMGAGLQELLMVILFFHGLFHVHLLLVLTLLLQVAAPLKES